MSSEFVIRRYLQNALVGRKEAEKPINVRPHFTPIHLDVITKTLEGHLSIPAAVFTGELHQVLSSSIHKRLDNVGGELRNTQGTLVTLRNIAKETPALVYSGGRLQGVMTNSFKLLGSEVFTSILNKALKKYLRSNQGFDKGHTYIEDPQGLAVTPSTVQADEVITRLNDLNTEAFTAEQAEVLNKLREQLLQHKADFKIHAEYSQTVQATLSKEFGLSNALLSVSANIVLIQDASENRGWGTVEKQLLKDVSKSLLTVHFSRNLLEEVSYRIRSIMQGTKIVPTKAKKNLEPIKKPSKTQKVPSSPVVMPRIRTNTGQFYSLTSLQTLINTHLQSVISANMGGGSETKVLNYRTGRFASSAKVERLSQSRAGMITAFYSYMRNPYQTFEPGFAQGSPASRNPKNLISTSIREIAATKVANQLRAVSV